MNLLLGIGNPRHGDDGLGPLFARVFRHPEWRCVNAATAPENFASLVRRLHPELLVLLDAADLGLPPGTLRRLDPAAIRAGDFGAPAGSIGQLAEYLADCAGHVVVLGIQPAGTRPGARLSPPVRAALHALGRTLASGQLPP